MASLAVWCTFYHPHVTNGMLATVGQTEFVKL